MFYIPRIARSIEYVYIYIYINININVSVKGIDVISQPENTTLQFSNEYKSVKRAIIIFLIQSKSKLKTASSKSRS